MEYTKIVTEGDVSRVTGELQQYIDVLWSDADLIELRPLPVNSGEREWLQAVELLEPERIARLIRENRFGGNLYAGVLPRTAPGKSKDETIRGGRVVWADFDHTTPEAAIVLSSEKGFPSPSMAVNTGNGVHLFWKLSRFETKATICDLVTRMSVLFGSDTSVKNAERILRLPGFVNHKRPLTFSSIVYAESTLVYPLSELDSLLPELPKVKRKERKKAKRSKHFKSEIKIAESERLEIRRARKYIDTISDDGSGRNKAAFKAAAVMVNDLALSESEALPLLEEWDLKKNNPAIQHDTKYRPDELERIVRNAAKYAKKESGNLVNVPKVEVVLPTSFGDEAEAQKGGRPKSARKAIQDYLDCGGLIQQVCEYIDRGAYCVQPELSLGATLAFLGVVFGRVVRDSTNTRTNLYIIGTAPSGSGKDRALTALTDIADAAELLDIIGPSGYRSGSALIKTLSKSPRCLSLIDEAGLFFRGVNVAGKTSNHAIEIIKNMMELYSKSGSVYKAPAAAGYETRPVINPCLGIYGCTVPESLYEGLPKESITNGFLARVLIIDGRSMPVEQEPDCAPVPESLVQELEYWRDLEAKQRGGGNLKEYAPPNPMTIPIAAGVKDYYMECRRSCKKKGDEVGEPWNTLWTRTIEIGKRLSLIHACSMGREPVISLASAKWGCGLSSILTELMIERLQGHIAENEMERNHQRILQIISRGYGGKPLTKSRLTRKTQFVNARTRDEIINTLKESEQIEEFVGDDSKQGATTTFYRVKG